ncbi:hypothetical protein QF000_002449 [Paraburkholderia atlantica]|uniref:Uncharacterized protein n=1 Tax=Paraburkholderia atlantica TaxID=2654982 RepID=A0A7W8PSP5_PARAM|nr:hypothetical protein [Paraburkholderia atlantica]MBB5426016.1 hypothetical protein [Paraburkholderia atlantica]
MIRSIRHGTLPFQDMKKAAALQLQVFQNAIAKGVPESA